MNSKGIKGVELIVLFFICIKTGSSTLPRPTTKATDTDLIRSDKPATTASTTSLYDNVTSSSNQGQGQQGQGIIQINN